MPANMRVTTQKFLCKLTNGDIFETDVDDFSQHLKGGVLEDIRAVFNVQIDWNARISGGASSYYYDKNGTDFDSSDDTFIFRVSGKDFSIDGFAVGDAIRISDAYWRIVGTITSMSNGEIIV